jgi:hypothetical protein
MSSQVNHRTGPSPDRSGLPPPRLQSASSAFPDSLLHGVALTALDKIGVLAQHREPERQVRIRDLIQRIRGNRRAVRPDSAHVAGSTQPVQGVVDALLGAAGDARPAASARPEGSQNPLVAASPVEVLAEDVQRITQQQPAGRERDTPGLPVDAALPEDRASAP